MPPQCTSFLCRRGRVIAGATCCPAHSSTLSATGSRGAVSWIGSAGTDSGAIGWLAQRASGKCGRLACQPMRPPSSPSRPRTAITHIVLCHPALPPCLPPAPTAPLTDAQIHAEQARHLRSRSTARIRDEVKQTDRASPGVWPTAGQTSRCMPPELPRTPIAGGLRLHGAETPGCSISGTQCQRKHKSRFKRTARSLMNALTSMMVAAPPIARGM